MWKPRRLTTLWVFTTCWRDSFYFFLTFTPFSKWPLKETQLSQNRSGLTKSNAVGSGSLCAVDSARVCDGSDGTNWRCFSKHKYNANACIHPAAPLPRESWPSLTDSMRLWSPPYLISMLMSWNLGRGVQEHYSALVGKLNLFLWDSFILYVLYLHLFRYSLC
jgi:hypothetical protein